MSCVWSGRKGSIKNNRSGYTKAADQYMVVFMIEDFYARPLYERSAIIHAETIKFNVNELLSGISFPNEELKSQVLVNLYSFFIACNEEILHFSDDENTQTFLRLSKSISDEDNFSKIIKKESQYISLWMNSFRMIFFPLAVKMSPFCVL